MIWKTIYVEQNINKKHVDCYHYFSTQSDIGKDSYFSIKYTEDIR